MNLLYRNGLAGLAGTLLIHAADAGEPATPRFAAPDVAASLPAGGASGVGQVSLALLVVLAAVFALAWLLKRLRSATGQGPHGIEVLSQVSLGAKERAVIVRVAGARLLLGVASGGVTLLQTLPDDGQGTTPAVSPVAAARPGFAELLRKSLGR